MKLAFLLCVGHHAEMRANSNLGTENPTEQDDRQQPGAFCLRVGSLIPEQSLELSGISGDYPRNAGDLFGDRSPNFRGSSGISCAKSFESGDHEENGVFSR